MFQGELQVGTEHSSARWRNWTLLWAGVIVATSCTVVQSKAFVRAVSTGTPVAISERGFQRFWSSWWWVFVKGYHVMEFALLTYLIYILQTFSLFLLFDQITMV